MLLPLPNRLKLVQHRKMVFSFGRSELRAEEGILDAPKTPSVERGYLYRLAQIEIRKSCSELVRGDTSKGDDQNTWCGPRCMLDEVLAPMQEALCLTAAGRREQADVTGRGLAEGALRAVELGVQGSNSIRCRKERTIHWARVTRVLTWRRWASARRLAGRAMNEVDPIGVDWGVRREITLALDGRSAWRAQKSWRTACRTIDARAALLTCVGSCHDDYRAGSRCTCLTAARWPEAHLHRMRRPLTELPGDDRSASSAQSACGGAPMWFCP